MRNYYMINQINFHKQFLVILIVQRWSSFLPLHNFTVSRIDNVGVEFERLLKQAIINDDSRMQFWIFSGSIWKIM